MKKTIIVVMAMVLISGCTVPVNNQTPQINFIKNASHGMVVNFSSNDAVLVGRGGYYKVINGNKYSVVMCEECGTDNDCLQNNLNRIKAYSGPESDAVITLTKDDLVFFYVFVITYQDVKPYQLANETFADTYQRTLQEKCNNDFYTRLIGLLR